MSSGIPLVGFSSFLSLFLYLVYEIFNLFSRALCDDWSVLVGSQGGQRLLAVELPGENLEEELCGEVLPACLETKVS